jgi:addiction module HigA family antidote
MLLEEFLSPSKTSQRAFAKRLGWTTTKLNELINGKRGITADSALDLSAELGTTPELWLNLQMYFDLNRATARRRAS